MAHRYIVGKDVSVGKAVVSFDRRLLLDFPGRPPI